MYENILIPTDGSEQATTAVKAGLGLAEYLGATIHPVSVLEDFESRGRADHRETGRSPGATARTGQRNRRGSRRGR